jgi:hypothetical protein
MPGSSNRSHPRRDTVDVDLNFQIALERTLGPRRN